jgi:small subunit ribosomal protein S5
MAEEIKKENNNDFKPIPTQEQSDAKEVAKADKKGMGFKRQGRGAPRPGFGRAGFGKDRPKDDIQTKLLDLARVTRVTGGGKRLRFRAVVIAGDKKGKIGIGIDKGRDVSQAVEKATRRARKNLISIVILEGTIPHEVQAKLGPAVILLKPQKKGRGLVAGGTVRIICELAGIRNVSSKILSGSKNKLNNARATIEALKKLKARK